MDFRSTASPKTLAARAQLLKRTREFFDKRGFVEVQTPLLSMDTVVDEHLDPVPVLLPNDATNSSAGRDLFLQTSPEFHMKRLLASGMTKIYQIAHAFRVGEVGDQHNPEFTMLEWYRCGDDMQAGMQLLSEFASEILRRPLANMLAMSAVFERHLKFDPFPLSAQELRRHCDLASISYPDSTQSEDWDAWFELLFGNLIQPKLGLNEPAIVFDYPASQAALAKIRKNETGHAVSERFELFVDGVELANGYHELLDADELLARNHQINQKRARHGKAKLPENSRLVDAMRHGLPCCSGVAVGFDRLVMLSLGLSSIQDVLSFPISRA